MKKLIFTILIISLFVGMAIAKDIGPLTYADSNVENDTLRFVQLQYTAGSGSLVGKWLYCASTTDLASPMFEACLIQKYTYTTGLCIVDTASSADIGFSANGTAGDIFWVLDNPPANALIRRGLTATKVATGVDPLDYMLYLTNSADSADVAAEFIRSFIEDLESDADTTELTVQQIMGLIDTEVPTLQTDLDELTDEWRTITAYVDHVKADSVWSSVATHEVFTFPTGAEVEFELTVQDSIALQGGDSLIVKIGANKIVALLKNDWDAGEYAQCGLTAANFIAGAYNVYNTAIASCGVNGESTGSITLSGVSKGIDIGYEVQTNTIVNAGYSIWTLRYLVRNGTGVVTAGDGTAL